MIWTQGRLIPPDRLAVPLADRIFEHGLGLFETLRTWDGRAPLLDRHLDRLRQSADALGIDLAGVPLPDQAAVAQLCRTVGLNDALVRLTVSGGRPPDLPPTAWLAARPVPPGPPDAGYHVVDAPWPVVPGDRLARHKTLNYWSRRAAHESAQARGADDAILGGPDGQVWEASRASLFLVAGRTLHTPPSTGPIIPGVMRAVVLERAADAGFAANADRQITGALVAAADEVFLANSVRGLIPVRAWDGRFERPAGTPFPATARLTRAVRDFLGLREACP